MRAALFPTISLSTSIGTAVLGGTVLSTSLGLFFVPVFFLLVRSWVQRRRAKAAAGVPPLATPALSHQGGEA